MSYTKQTWQTGEVITATKLNHMEDGIENAGGGGALIIEMTLDETDPHTPFFKSNVLFDDVVTAFTSGTPVMVHTPKAETWGVQNDEYMMLYEYTTMYDNPYFGYSANGSSVLNGFYEGDNGYFCEYIYID